MRSSTWRCGTTSGSGSRCACVPHARWRSRFRSWASRWRSPKVRRSAPRSPPSSAGTRSSPSSTPGHSTSRPGGPMRRTGSRSRWRGHAEPPPYRRVGTKFWSSRHTVCRLDLNYLPTRRWSVVEEPLEDASLLCTDPQRPALREVDRHDHRSRVCVENPLPVGFKVHDVVVDGERGRPDLADPGLDPDRPRPVVEDPLVVDLVPRHDQAVILVEVRRMVPKEQHVDPRLLEIAQVHHVVDVCVGVLVTPPQWCVIYVSSHTAILPAIRPRLTTGHLTWTRSDATERDTQQIGVTSNARGSDRFRSPLPDRTSEQGVVEGRASRRPDRGDDPRGPRQDL